MEGCGRGHGLDCFALDDVDGEVSSVRKLREKVVRSGQERRRFGIRA